MYEFRLFQKKSFNFTKNKILTRKFDIQPFNPCKIFEF